jgi:hypothetical protein
MRKCSWISISTQTITKPSEFKSAMATIRLTYRCSTFRKQIPSKTSKTLFQAALPKCTNITSKRKPSLLNASKFSRPNSMGYSARQWRSTFFSKLLGCWESARRSSHSSDSTYWPSETLSYSAWNSAREYRISVRNSIRHWKPN